MAQARYQFDGGFDAAPAPSRRHHRRHPSTNSENEDNDPTDGNGSLTYSAASSINSAAGESTDSSLAGIMRVLDVQDSKELAAVLEKERAKKHAKEDRSVAAESQHSLAYSTDAESAMKSLHTEQSLRGTNLVGTIAGQTSDQNEYDGGNFPRAAGEGYGGGGGRDQASDYNPHNQPHHSKPGDKPHDDSISAPDSGIVFAEAEYTDSVDSVAKLREDKRRQMREDKEKKRRDKQTDNQTPRVKNSKKSSSGASSSLEENAPPRQSRGMAASPPMNSRPPKRGESLEMHEEEDVWYAKWWMFCFPDTVKTMTPKR